MALVTTQLLRAPKDDHWLQDEETAAATEATFDFGQLGYPTIYAFWLATTAAGELTSPTLMPIATPYADDTKHPLGGQANPQEIPMQPNGSAPTPFFHSFDPKDKLLVKVTGLVNGQVYHLFVLCDDSENPECQVERK